MVETTHWGVSVFIEICRDMQLACLRNFVQKTVFFVIYPVFLVGNCIKIQRNPSGGSLQNSKITRATNRSPLRIQNLKISPRSVFLCDLLSAPLWLNEFAFLCALSVSAVKIIRFS